MMHPKLRVFAFLVIANLAWVSTAWWGLDHATWLWVTPIALSINALLLTYDQVLKFTRVQGEPLLGQDAWGVLKIVHELSEKFELPLPRVFLVPHASAHVFCYGRTGKQTRLYITEGTLKLLSPDELRAVLTYQMCVMNSSLSILNYWLGATLDLFFRVGQFLERGFSFVFGWTPAIAAVFISPWTWLFQKILMSPRDFLKLDHETAQRLGQAETLAQALWKMQSYAQTQPWLEPWVFAHMCMVSPLGYRHVLPWLHIQPDVKGRIKTLTGRYPL